MHKVHQSKQRPLAVLDAENNPVKIAEDLLWVDYLTHHHQAKMIECHISFGFQSDEHSIARTRFVTVRVENIPNGLQYYDLLCSFCGEGGFMAVSPEKVLAFMAQHPEHPYFEELGATGERALSEPDKFVKKQHGG